MCDPGSHLWATLLNDIISISNISPVHQSSESEYKQEILHTHTHTHTLGRLFYSVKNTLSPFSVDYDINITPPTACLDTDGDNEILWDSERSCFQTLRL